MVTTFNKEVTKCNTNTICSNRRPYLLTAMFSKNQVIQRQKVSKRWKQLTDN